jgi:hydrogenase maturation protease
MVGAMYARRDQPEMRRGPPAAREDEYERILIYGYGNPGRGDDGLGPALVARLETDLPTSVGFESNYQLELEDAAELALYDVVIFVDADVSGPEPFWFGSVDASVHLGWSSHSVSAGTLIALAGELFGKTVRAYTLGIRGYDFDGLREALSSAAEGNLRHALAFVRRAIHDRQFEAYVQQYGIGSGRAGQAEAEPPRDIVP